MRHNVKKVDLMGALPCAVNRLVVCSLDEANDSNPNGVMSRRGVLVAGGVLGAQWMQSAPKSHHSKFLYCKATKTVALCQ